MQPLNVVEVQLSSLKAMSVWKKKWLYCEPRVVGICSTKLAGYVPAVVPVGHSVQ